MNLYLISQIDNTGYDTYDSAVVAAKTQEDAKKIHPRGEGYEWNGSAWGKGNVFYGTWASKPENVTIEFIGKASKGTMPGVILASFNAG